MMIKLGPVFLFIALITTSCKQLPDTSPYVDLPSQIRSMMYTHRNLLELKLDSTSLKSEQRHQILMTSHCDLIDRRMVYAKNKPEFCQVAINVDSRKCIAAFHLCIKACPMFLRHCPTCENQAIRCL